MTEQTGRHAAQVASVTRVFDLVADTYDSVGVPWFQPIAEATVRAVTPQPAECALDLGCGRGAALVPLAHAVGPTGSVLGVDVAPRMVEMTRADVERLGLAQVQVAVMDAADPDLPESAFDVAVASLVLFFLPDPAAALRGWRPLLREGGRLAVSTFAEADPLFGSLDDVFTPYLPQAMLDARASGRRGPFASDEGVAGLLAGAGFDAVTTTRFGLQLAFAAPEAWETWSRSHGQRAMWDLVPDPDVDQVREQAYQLLQDGRGPDGVTRLTQQVRVTAGVAP